MEDKTILTPINDPKEPSKTEADKYARKELEKLRNETQRYKRDYFNHYNDVKISHREDWWNYELY